MAIDDVFFLNDDKIDFAPRPGDFSQFGDIAASWQRGRWLTSAILHEIRTIATFTATAASIVNFANQNPGPGARALASIEAYLPRPPVLAPTSLDALVQAELPLAIINRMQDLAPRIELAKAVTIGIRGQATSSGERDIEGAVVAWRKLCEATIELMQDLLPYSEAECANVDPDELSPAQAVERLLAAAALGGWPCIGEDGSIEIPGWLERRRDRRLRIELACSLKVGSRTWPVRTVDLSRHGAGLAGAPDLPVGARGEVRLNPVCSMAGTIVWCAEGRLGFRFDGPLSPIGDLDLG
ncbi:MAG: PilZ domain-containing protein [Hyphomicrobiaceae bacterium]